MYKYLPTENNVALKTSLNKVISENNISSNKISKAIGVDTSHLKVLRDPENTKLEISPEQYINLVKYLAPKKVELNLGPEPENFFDKFMFYLFRKGITFDDFCSIARKNKTEIKNMFTKNGVSSRYKDTFTPLINDEEFNNLNSYNSIVLSGDRDSKIIRNINSATLINVFMIKRGFTIKDLSVKTNYKEDQVRSILQGFILDSNLIIMSDALQIPMSTLDNVVLNSWDPDNNFGYFLQKTILERKHNVYSMSELIDIPYCDLKGIVSGTRNIKSDEFDKIASGLNIDPDDLRMKAPNIVEGDDKYISWNFIKWTTEHPEITMNDLSKSLNKDAGSLIERIKSGRTYRLPEITVLMTVTGLSKEQLRAKLSDEEIESIKTTKRKSGRKYNGDPNSFDMFIRNHIDEKGITLTEFAELVGLERTTLAHYMREGRVEENVLENILLVLDLTKNDIEKFKVKTFKGRKREVTTMNNKELEKEEQEIKEENNEEISKSWQSDVDDLIAKNMARTIFHRIENGNELKIKYNSGEYAKLIDNIDFREKVINYMNIILIDNMMADCIINVGKHFLPGEKATYLSFRLIKPEPEIKPTYYPAGDKSIYESFSINKSIGDFASNDTNQEITEVTEDDRDFMIEELDKFLELYSNLKESDQCTLLRMMNLVKHPNDIKMNNIPEECFWLGKFAEYKKIDTLVKLIGLDK